MGTFQIHPATLVTLLGSPLSPDIIDVCLPEDHADDPRIIPGAVRMEFAVVEQSSAGIDRACVIVCQKGLKLSQGVAALLRAQGRDAVYLPGGMMSWAQAAHPLWPAALHISLGQHGQRWVLPTHVTPTDLWSAWVVQRCIDPNPTWLFVEPEQIDLVCARFGAFDPGEAAVALCASSDGMSSKLRALQTHVTQDAFAQMLHGTCMITPRSAQGVTVAAVIFDSLWAKLDGAA